MGKRCRPRRFNRSDGNLRWRCYRPENRRPWQGRCYINGTSGSWTGQWRATRASSLKRMVMNKRGVQAMSIRVLLMAMGLAPLALFASVDPAPAPHSAAVEAPAAVAAADPFPVPAGLRDNVAFWRKVLAEWRQNQVALHDMDYPGIVYDVVELQGGVQDSLSDDQREEVGQLRSNLESRLQRLGARRRPLPRPSLSAAGRLGAGVDVVQPRHAGHGARQGRIRHRLRPYRPRIQIPLVRLRLAKFLRRISRGA